MTPKMRRKHQSGVLPRGGRHRWQRHAPDSSGISVLQGGEDVDNSDIQKIGRLVITEPTKDDKVTGFQGCERLRSAEGNYPGHVNFAESGNEKIGELIATGGDFQICGTLTQISEAILNNHEIRI